MTSARLVLRPQELTHEAAEFRAFSPGDGANALEFPPLAEGQYLGMSLGTEYSVKKIKPGVTGEINLVQHTLMPKLKPGTRCFDIEFDIEEVVVGGFTILVRAVAPRSK